MYNGHWWVKDVVNNRKEYLHNIHLPKVGQVMGFWSWK